MATTLQDLAKDAGTTFILALFVDLRGKPCAKLVPVEAIDSLATEGVGFAGYAVGRLASAVGVTPGGIGLTEVATTGALVAWGADPAAASAGAVLFAVVTNLMEVPIGGLAWLWLAVDPTGARRGGIAGTDDVTGDVSG